MFCPKCGFQMPDSAQVCPQCGSQIVTYAVQTAPLEGATQVMNPAPTANSAQSGTAPMPAAYIPPQQQYSAPNGAANPTPPYNPNMAVPMAPMAPVSPKKKRKWPIFVALIVILAIAAGAFFTLRGFNTPEAKGTPTGIVDDATDAILDLDFDRMLNTLPPEVVEYLTNRAGYSDRAELVSFLNESVSQLDGQVQQFGIDTRTLLKLVDVKTSNVSYYSEDGLAGLKTTWNERIPGFGDTFQEAATVTVELGGELDLFGHTISFSDYIGTAKQDVTTVKIGNQWYLLYSDVLPNVGMPLIPTL